MFKKYLEYCDQSTQLQTGQFMKLFLLLVGAEKEG